ncbi:hypothetical protein [Dickeya zeae]|nr:hypothetical protein [Dickeya zeae]UJR62122.1 hypothetical protein HJ586_07815 [Dickeya zeae]
MIRQLVVSLSRASWLLRHEAGEGCGAIDGGWGNAVFGDNSRQGRGW